ncbi:MAG: acyl-CoA thioesterase [Crocinitomicaceae bacterium]|nr:acyl-CoA thioesterase [Crocinitomicaceae bacterium]
MYTHNIKTRIRYGETDKMGYCYYGNYAQFFEMGRVELLRSLGVSYKELEDQGIMLPVSKLNVNYLRPVFYDEEITITTKIAKLPTAKIIFDYEIKNEKGVVTTTGETTLVFIRSTDMRPTQPPKSIIEELSKHF